MAIIGEKRDRTEARERERMLSYDRSARRLDAYLDSRQSDLARRLSECYLVTRHWPDLAGFQGP
jgi:hypothetical protein